MRRLRPALAHGFTLVELLIVIVVLGILTGMVLFALGTFKNTSAAAACAADTRSVKQSAESVLGHSGDYPDGTYTSDATVAGNATNPLVAGAVAPPGPGPSHGRGKAQHPHDAYDNGAVLARYPDNSAYQIVYTGASDGKSFTISVNKASGGGWVGVGQCSNL